MRWPARSRTLAEIKGAFCSCASRSRYADAQREFRTAQVVRRQSHQALARENKVELAAVVVGRASRSAACISQDNFTAFPPLSKERRALQQSARLVGRAAAWDEPARGVATDDECDRFGLFAVTRRAIRINVPGFERNRIAPLLAVPARPRRTDRKYADRSHAAVRQTLRRANGGAISAFLEAFNK